MHRVLNQFASIASFAGGIHPPERKNLTAEAAIESIPAPHTLTLPLTQHIGAPCEPVVKPADEVSWGDLVGEATSFVSARLHAPLCATIKKIKMVTMPNARSAQAIVLNSNGAHQHPSGQALWDELYGGDWLHEEIEKHDPTNILAAISKAGVVGLGGATFPTHVKLTPNGNKIDSLLINGCECEPYLTSDYRLMLEAPQLVVTGALLAARAIRAGRVVICLEANKSMALKRLREAASGTTVETAVLKTKYPQGGEKQLIMAVLKREVPLGGLPLDAGVVVMNVATAGAVAQAVIRDKPLTHRIVTVSGEGVANPKNLLVPIGITFAELIAFCGGFTEDAARIIAGGPMMGFSVVDLDTPVTKGTSGVTILTHKDINEVEETACLRCGQCVDVCPMHLVPTKLAAGTRHTDLEILRRYNIEACVECGSCAYTCPAGLPLVQIIRTGKTLARNVNKARSN